MTADIHPLGPRQHKERFAPVPDVVEVLYKLLDAAKKGELQGIAFATVVADELNADGRAGSGFAIDEGAMFTMSHAMGILTRRWGRYCDGEPD